MTFDGAGMERKPLWTIEEIVSATGGQLQGKDNAVPNGVTGISIDSRTIEDGHAFFAIKGERFDGHDFVSGAAAAGAALCIVSSDRAPSLSGMTGLRLVVPDVLGALEDLGRAARARMSGKVIAVTGSVGKTGTKEALRLALAPSGRLHAADKSFNNHWGVPLTLARMPSDTEFGIFEIGMNHPGEIRPLVKMVRPHLAIITTVEAVHLEFFDSVEQIALAKAEIFEGVEPEGSVLLNADNPHYNTLRDLATAQSAIQAIESFGRVAGADVRLLDSSVHDSYSDVTVSLFGKHVSYRIGAPGQHHIGNSLSVIGAVARVGGNVDAACAALSGVKAPKGRGERWTLSVKDAQAVLIDESYNANPVSMGAALDLLGQFKPGDQGRRIAVLGDMLELGESGAGLHAALAERVAVNSVDLVYCCGPLMRSLWDCLPSGRQAGYAATSEDIAQSVIETVAPGDVVMVKGSLGSRMGPLVEALLTRYDAVTSSRENSQR